jgi:hypothetical protein
MWQVPQVPRGRLALLVFQDQLESLAQRARWEQQDHKAFKAYKACKAT